MVNELLISPTVFNHRRQPTCTYTRERTVEVSTLDCLDWVAQSGSDFISHAPEPQV